MTHSLPRADYANTVRERRTYGRATTDYALLTTRRMYDPHAVAIYYPVTPLETEAAVTRKQLALLIAGHNEELVIEQTLRSAINAGMDPQDIFVVDDNSDDETRAIAMSVLGEDHVLSVDRSGKGLALTKGAKHFKLTDRYEWIHIADADGGFAENYFGIFKGRLNKSNAAATGYIRSLPGSTIGQYRVYEYTIGMEIHRRFQALTQTVSVIPGPTSCFRADVFDKVNFANKSLTEDFDVTLQIHRQKLGKIQFIPDATAYTQDPRTRADFLKQITRWNRGIMQSIVKHRVGFTASRVDAYLMYQIFQNFLLLFNYLFLLPYMAITRGTADVIAFVFLMDVAIMFAITTAIALKMARMDIISAFPQIYAYRWVSLGVFLKAFWEVIVRGKHRVTEGTWSTAGRRYKMPIAA